MAPPGFFIGGAKKNGVWGGAPDNFLLDHATVGQIMIFLDKNRSRHKMVQNAVKAGN